jgi:Lipocalin-like domain
MVAYSATYTVESDKVVHHVDAAWNPAWVGHLIRPFILDGDTLVIRTGQHGSTTPTRSA